MAGRCGPHFARCVERAGARQGGKCPKKVKFTTKSTILKFRLAIIDAFYQKMIINSAEFSAKCVYNQSKA
ncbi:MAG: hypothetical protein DU430_01510 [Candidatus Tokpelaia sp.]|nr:MAG: hypothetical protein DU430_01510 [Candidatus Tokpelaia sp.]